MVCTNITLQSGNGKRAIEVTIYSDGTIIALLRQVTGRKFLSMQTFEPNEPMDYVAGQIIYMLEDQPIRDTLLEAAQQLETVLTTFIKE